MPAGFQLSPVTLTFSLGMQEVMEEPVLAADGYSYERSAILQWLQLGHTTSPMTNQPLEHPGLTSNRALRAAIQQWKS